MQSSARLLAAQTGWNEVEASLHYCATLPEAFFAGSARHFESLRSGTLANA